MVKGSSYNNYVDKIVDVENKGKSDAYVRTIFAVPTAGQDADTWLKLSWNNGTDSKWDFARLDNELVNINGVEYRLYVATYKEPLKGSESNNNFDKVTTPALFGLYMDSKVDFEGTDGNNGYYTWNGNALVGDLGTTKVLVATQAVQVAGFEPSAQVSAGTEVNADTVSTGHLDSAKAALKEAFGDISATNNPWKDTAAIQAWRDEVKTNLAAGGYSTAETALEIGTVDQMIQFANLVNEDGESFSGKFVKLTADISLAGINWKPIGQTSDGNYYTGKQFYGTFDGNNKTISNLKVTHWDAGDNEGANYASGLFGFIDNTGATIKNVKLTNATVKGHHWTGALVGYMTGTVENCSVAHATIECSHENTGACGDKAGAVVGYLNNPSTLTNCHVENSTVNAGRDAGQVVGAYYSTSSSVNGCAATNVSVTKIENENCSGANINNEIVGRDCA